MEYNQQTSNETPQKSNAGPIIGLIVLIVAVIVVMVGLIAYSHKTATTENSQEIQTVNTVVTDFGTHLQNVSLTAPKDTIVAAMENQYKPYVTVDLLSKWEADPTTAPGRLTSSPWPDHITISSTDKNSDGSYTVKGQIAYFTSVEMANGGTSATQDVTLTLTLADDTWRISIYEGGEYGAGRTPSGTTSDTTGTNGVSDQNQENWKVYSQDNPGLSLAYPDVFTATKGAPQNQESTYWSQLAQSGNTRIPGETQVTLILPDSFEPNTNFQEAILTVGDSSDPDAVNTCKTPASSSQETQGKDITRGANNYTTLTLSDAGAGNIYDTTSYRMIKNNKCYAIEYTIHTTQLANYPAGTRTAYDKTKLTQELNNVINTVTFK